MDSQLSEALTPLLKRLDDLAEELRRVRADLAEQRPDYLSIRRAAEVTDLSYDHIRRAVESGELPATDKGNGKKRVYRIARADLDRWMRKGRSGPTLPPRPVLKSLMSRYLPNSSC